MGIMLNHWQKKTQFFPLSTDVFLEEVMNGREYGPAQLSGPIRIRPILDSNCPTGTYLSPTDTQLHQKVIGPGQIGWHNQSQQVAIIPLHGFVPHAQYGTHVLAESQLLAPGQKESSLYSFSMMGREQGDFLPHSLRYSSWQRRQVKGHAKLCQDLKAYVPYTPVPEDVFPLLPNQTGIQVWIGDSLVAWEMGPDTDWWASVHISRVQALSGLATSAHQPTAKLPSSLRRTLRQVKGYHQLIDLDAPDHAGQLILRGHQVAFLSLFGRS